MHAVTGLKITIFEIFWGLCPFLGSHCTPTYTTLGPATLTHHIHIFLCFDYFLTAFFTAMPKGLTTCTSTNMHAVTGLKITIFEIFWGLCPFLGGPLHPHIHYFGACDNYPSHPHIPMFRLFFKRFESQPDDWECLLHQFASLQYLCYHTVSR
jgi:hypothetical protein